MMATLSVLDASAILALILGEMRGQRLTPELLNNSVVSSVNAAEVQAKLVREGWNPDVAWDDVTAIASSIKPFIQQHAKLAGSLIAHTRPLGLSLGDRSCLALAISLNAPVYTTDQTWRNLNLGIPIHILDGSVLSS